MYIKTYSVNMVLSYCNYGESWDVNTLEDIGF